LVEVLFTIAFIEIYGAVDVSLTVTVSPGGEQCFVQEIAANSEYEIDYQVRLIQTCRCTQLLVIQKLQKAKTVIL